MDNKTRTVVTFSSSLFNTTVTKDYFINPYCFGDDLAAWLINKLQERGVETDSEPGQEDFGWYFDLMLPDAPHCLVIGFRPYGPGYGGGQWICTIERSRGFIGSMLGMRKRGISPDAPHMIHSVLSESPDIRDILWHLDKDFSAGREERGTPGP